MAPFPPLISERSENSMKIYDFQLFRAFLLCKKFPIL